MEKFEIIRTGKIRDVYAIFINGIRVRQKDLTVELNTNLKNDNQQKFKLTGWFDKSSYAKESLLKLKFSDLLKLNLYRLNFYRLKLLNINDFPSNKNDVSWQSPEICFGGHEYIKDLKRNFMFIETDLTASYLDLSSWNKKYSLNQYKEEFIKQFKDYSREFLAPGDFESRRHYRNFDVVILIEDLEEKVGDFFERIRRILAEIHVRTIETIEQKSIKENSIKEFDFPPDVRVVCEQYLHYFVDFLKDVGVKATANIEHDKLGRTLFKVQPENPKIALATIREALEIYLELPMSPLIDEEDISDSKILALRAEINTLKTRLDLAQIKQLETEKRANLQRELIDTQKRILWEKDNQIQTLQRYEPRHFEPSIVYESAVETDFVDAEIVEETNTEKITEISNKEIDLGLVTVKPTKIGLGVEANTPRLARLGIKKGKELFDYLDKKFNSEEDKE
jgi:hypothetical protein